MSRIFNRLKVLQPPAIDPEALPAKPQRSHSAVVAAAAGLAAAVYVAHLWGHSAAVINGKLDAAQANIRQQQQQIIALDKEVGDLKDAQQAQMKQWQDGQAALSEEMKSQYSQINTQYNQITTDIGQKLDDISKNATDNLREITALNTKLRNFEAGTAGANNGQD